MRLKKLTFSLFVLFVSGNIQSQNDSAGFWFDRVFESAEQKRFSSCLQYCIKYLKVRPGNELILQYAMESAANIGQYADAENFAVELTRINTDKLLYLKSARDYALMNRDIDLAEHYGMRALKLNRYDFDNYLKLGHVYAFKHNQQRCLLYYLSGLQYITSMEIYNNSWMPDFYYFDKTTDYPYEFKLLKNEFDLYIKDYAGNKIPGNQTLDSITLLTSSGQIDRDNPELLRLEQQFITEDSRNAYIRELVQRNAYWDLGWWQHREGSTNKSLEQYYMNAVKLTANIGDSAGLIDIWVELGTISQPLGNNLIFNGIDFAKHIHDDERLTYLYYQLNRIKIKSNEEDSAYYYARLAYLSSLKCQNENLKTTCFDNLFFSFALLGLTDSADYYYQLAHWVNSPQRTVSDQYYLDYNYCIAYYQAKKYKEVIRLGRKFLPVYNEWTDVNEGDIEEYMGRSFEKTGNNDSAKYYLFESIRKYRTFLEQHPDNKNLLKARKNAIRTLKNIAMQQHDTDDMFTLHEFTQALILKSVLSDKNLKSDIPTLAELQAGLKPDEVALQYAAFCENKNDYILGIEPDQVKIYSNLYRNIEPTMKQMPIIPWDRIIAEFSKIQSVNRWEISAQEKRLMAAIGFMIFKHIDFISGKGVSRGSALLDVSWADQKDSLNMQFNRVLYDTYFRPIESFVSGKKVIYLSVNGFGSMIPFEELRNDTGAYLGSIFQFVYVPSFTVQKILKNMPKNSNKNLLVIGNPAYRSFNPSSAGSRGYDLASMGFGSWNDLPGTAKEMQSIKAIVPDEMELSGAQVNETVLKKMNESGQLHDYAMIHFSMHGLSTFFDVKNNSLVITEPEGSEQDGFLFYSEIPKLHLNADLVCLSACETAVGMASETEEVKNLPLAFLAAGAKNVIGSWWQVDDAATGLFMAEFYRLVFKENKRYPEAMQITRQAFATGKFGEKYKKPYYWAAFRYYGY